jgi:hypothetical protein
MERKGSSSSLSAFSYDESSSEMSTQSYGSPTRRATVPRVAHSPMIQAMLTSNTLRDCRQVEEMFSKCRSSAGNKDSFMCKTAEAYFMTCTKK